jgi:multimeric flavodoxin WrbA
VTEQPPRPLVRTGQGSTKLTRSEFQRRFRERFYDPAFESLTQLIGQLEEVSWNAYDEYRKTPRTRRAGPEFADPEFELPVEWLETRARILAAEREHRSSRGRSRVLLICASPRSDETCPGEMSKTFRLTAAAREAFDADGDIDVDFLDLSRLTSEYGRMILPCKACVSTAMPLCHWPCSCYPNAAMGQVNDWMHELYPRFVAAHGLMIVTPVHWFQAPSVLKLLMDRLVCADGGNPDPTTTHGKSPEEAKALESSGWSYPRHLAGRAFAVVVHGDTEGAGSLRRALSDWLSNMGLVPASGPSVIDRYVGYYEPYATSHEALDRDEDLFEEVRVAARSLANAVRQMRAGTLPPAIDLRAPRPK